VPGELVSHVTVLNTSKARRRRHIRCNTRPMPPRSTLARLQQALTIVTIAASAIFVVLNWRESPTRAVVGGLAIFFWATWFLALEFVFLRLASRKDPTPPATMPQLIVAWLRESAEAPLVFMWRQPFRWRSEPDHLAPSTSGKLGVVFIHGFVCNRGFWNDWMRRTREAGHAFVAVNLEPVFGSIDRYAPIIDEAVRKVTATTGRPPVLICHSMGGLAARAWLRASGTADRVHHIITIASPHRGTWISRFSHVENGRQMRLRSDWVGELAKSEGSREGWSVTCWYSNCDNIVFPPLTATLEGADNRLLVGAAHVDLAFRPEVMEHALGKLSGS